MLLCVAGVLVKYEEKARQKVAWVVLAGLPMGLTRLNLLLYPIIPRLYPIIPTGGGSSLVTLLMTMAMTNMSGHGSGWS